MRLLWVLESKLNRFRGRVKNRLFLLSRLSVISEDAATLGKLLQLGIDRTLIQQASIPFPLRGTPANNLSEAISLLVVCGLKRGFGIGCRSLGVRPLRLEAAT